MRPLLLLLLFFVTLFPFLAREAAADEFVSAHLEAMDAAVNAAIANHQIPGAVVWIERDSQPYKKAYGARQTTPKVEKMTLDTIFDLASLTKVVATTPSILKLIDEGKLKLEDPVSKFVPEFNKPGQICSPIPPDCLRASPGTSPGMAMPRDLSFPAPWICGSNRARNLFTVT